MKLVHFLTLLAFIVAATARSTNWTVGQTVQTYSGPVSGHAASNDTQVSEYLGIPFAQPPVGELRFAPPVKYQGNSSINGTNYVRTTYKLKQVTVLIGIVGFFLSSLANIKYHC